MSDTSDLAVRMKKYEQASKLFLTNRMPALIRLDGKAFHSFTKGMERPFDKILIESMWEAAQYLCENIMGAKLAYVQSDEITILLTDYDTLQTQPWFNKNVQKMVSVSASMATMAFNLAFFARAVLAGSLTHSDKALRAMFDSRVFTIPKEDVCNNFIWRQQDATRNAIQMVGQANFSHNQLMNKSCNDIQEMLFQEKGVNFNDMPTHLKRGACIVKEVYEVDGVIRTRWVVDKNIPIFTQRRDYVERLVYNEQA